VSERWLHGACARWGCEQLVRCILGLYMWACCLVGCTPNPAFCNTAVVSSFSFLTPACLAPC
jgi:hypothetical protein